MRTILALCLSALLVSCQLGRHSILFATNSSAGLDLDSTPPTASLAFARQEASVAPVTAAGDVLPMISTYQGGTTLLGNVFTANVSQTFAIGNAAWILARYLPDGSGTTVEMPGADPVPGANGDPAAYPWFQNASASGVAGSFDEVKPYLFGTETTLGLKVGLQPGANFAGGAPASLTFGWKRKEAALVPVSQVGGEGDGDSQEESGGARSGGTDSGTKLVLPPMLATTGADSTADGGIGGRVSQFYSTGHAASLLAANPLFRSYFLPRLGKDFADAFGLDVQDVEEWIRRGNEVEERAKGLAPELDAGELVDVTRLAAGFGLGDFESEERQSTLLPPEDATDPDELTRRRDLVVFLLSDLEVQEEVERAERVVERMSELAND